MTETPSTPQQPFACNVYAISAELRPAHTQNAEVLFPQVQQKTKLSDGYQFAFPRNPEILQRLGNFIAMESLCCPFFTFELQVPSGHDQVHLLLRGGEGIYEFIEQTILTRWP